MNCIVANVLGKQHYFCVVVPAQYDGSTHFQMPENNGLIRGECRSYLNRKWFPMDADILGDKAIHIF